MRRFAAAVGLVLMISACGASPAVERAVHARDASSTRALGSGSGATAAGDAVASVTDQGGCASNPTTTTTTPPTTTRQTTQPPPSTTTTTQPPCPATSQGAAVGAQTGGSQLAAGSSSRGGAGGIGIAVAGACGTLAPAGGNGGTTDTGVSGSTIKIGGTFFNGNYLDKYSQVTENAAKAYFQYVNDLGGICGRKIDYLTCDTAGTADGTQGCLSKLADQDNVFIMGPSLDFNLDTVQPSLASHKLPWVGDSGLYPAEFNSPWMFPTQIPGFNVGALIATYAGQTLHVHKAGISLLNEVAGPDCTRRAQQVAQKLGFDASATASNGFVESSLDSQVSRLRGAGVDSVLFCNDPVNTIKFIQAAQRVGWKPTFVGGFVAADDVPQAAGSYAVGMYGFTAYDFYKATTPGISEYRKITEYYYPTTFHHFYEQAAYIGAEAIVDALRRAGPDLTRSNFVTALKSFTDYDTGMGLKLNFANIAASPSTSGIMLQADNSLAWHVITGRFTPAA